MVIFLLRHADRAPGGGDALSPAGVRRAERLAQMLRDSKASLAYCSDAARTRQTLAPLEGLLGAALTINAVPVVGADGIQRHVDEIVRSLGEQPDEAVAVVVGHTNTVDRIIGGLGGGSIEQISETEFDKLFVLVGPPQDRKNLILLRY